MITDWSVALRCRKHHPIYVAIGQEELIDLYVLFISLVKRKLLQYQQQKAAKTPGIIWKKSGQWYVKDNHNNMHVRKHARTHAQGSPTIALT